MENTVNGCTGRILVVDHVPDDLQILKNLLVAHGHTVHSATDGQQALSSVSTEPFDLILSSFRLPKIDGFDICRRLKSQNNTANIPIIFIHNQRNSGDSAEAFRAGAADCINKPFQAEEVLVRVQTQLRLQELTQRLERHEARTAAKMRPDKVHSGTQSSSQRPFADKSEQMQLSDLFNIDELQNIQDLFAKATGVASLITDREGNPVTKPSNFCRLCEYVIRTTEKGFRRCRASDAALGQLNEDGPILRQCLSGGLWDAGASICVDGQHIGSWLIGQVLDESIDPDSLLSYAEEIGVDKEDYKEALSQVKRMPLAQFEKIAQALYLIANQLSKMALQNIQQARFIAEHKLMEDALRESEQKFRTLADNIPNLIVRYDCKLRRTYVNKTWEKASGLSAAQVVGIPGTAIPHVPSPTIAEYTKKLQQVLTTGIPEEIEFYWVNARAEKLFLRYAIVPEYNRHGEIIGVLAAGNDRTARRQEEELLHKREQEFRAMVENSPDTIVRYDKKCRRIYVNPAFSRRTNTSPKDVLGITPVVGSPVTDVVSYQNTICNALETGEEKELEYTWVDNDGKRKVSISRMVPEWGADGEIASILAIDRDITERKRYETLEAERLRLFEQMAHGGGLPELLDQVVAFAEMSCPDFQASIMLSDDEGKRLFTGSAPNLPPDYLAAIDGIEIGEGVGSCGTAVWRGESVITEDVETHPFWAPYKQLARQAGFRSCWSEPIFDSAGHVVGTFGIYRAIPGAPSQADRKLIHQAAHLASVVIEHKRMEEQLRISEQQYRTLAENSPNIIIRYNRECRCLYINPAFTLETGIPAPDGIYAALGSHRWQINIPQEEYLNRLSQVMSTGIPTEIRLEWSSPKTGHVISHAFHVVAERNPQSEIIGCLAIGHNITALREAELRLTKLADTSPGVLYTSLLCPNGTTSIPYISPRIEELNGLHPDEITADITAFRERMHPEDVPLLETSINVSARTLTPWHAEFRMVHPEKGEVWVEGRSVPESKADGTIHWSGFLHDITERKRAEHLLQVKREKIAAMTVELSLAEDRERRRIAGELHDHIGQTLLLGRIKLGSLTAQVNPPYEQSTLKEVCTLIDQTIQDVRSLTQQLHPPVLVSVGLEAALEWLARRMETDYLLQVFFADDQAPKPLTEEFSSVIYQSVRELLINVAKHAGTDTAWLTIGREEDMCLLTVKDKGKGFACIPDFGTTMAGDSDCSFGLFNVRQRIKLLGGEVVMHSVQGEGTCASIRIPLAQNEGEAPHPL
ncbi:PocR ligand-binding domain-containing protein [Desulfobulbus rhabdoformis]|uniref:PocR ligand-binding domain-containing protein n=1 Tax=Desulfobulbus rhabdoformis TaxID=34032 RepID=UPI001963BB94|nr:PocR ligand-binding domain-containing protein [Desulfobulbus rhabdoformis]MBM9616891.1 PocR ligand-binding domain-containing protein [Desulfobulbus rhabdoformis]